MDPERLKTIEELFHAAADLAPRERKSFLDEKCGADAELRAEVDSLLAFESTPGHFLDGSPEALAAEMFTPGELPGGFVGKTIGHYKIERLLGIGGMGEVYLAEDVRLQRKVALKLLPDAFSSAEDRLERLVFEARSASGLNHPNILTIHEIGESEGKKFITAEFVEGKTLKELISTHPPGLIPALEIAVQVASALVAAHAAGIVHRDVKPDNVMIRPDGIVKLLDFGIAKFIEPESGSRESHRPDNGNRPKIIVGTPDYMSPEQATGKDVDVRSDVFSFGAVLYELLTGKRAFGGENSHDTIRAIADNAPAPLAELVPDVPPAIAATVEKCLAKSAGDRYQSMKDVLNDLQKAKRILDLQTLESRNGTFNGSSEADHIEKVIVLDRPRWNSRLRAPATFVGGAFIVLLLALAGMIGYRFLVTPARISSVAIMPFANESGNPESEYLSDGMTENLIRSLSVIPDLSVKARSTVFTYKGKHTPPATIGSELNVDATIVGRMTQDGDKLKLDIELVDTSTQAVIWSANYERRNSELALLQRDMTRDVSVRLRPALTSDDQSRVAQSYSLNSEAQRLYLMGRFHWNKRNVRDFQRAAQYFEQAITKDPNYALALTGTADTYALMPLYGAYKPKDYIPKAKEAALRALELDQNLAEAHASLGYIKYSYDYDWDGAERELEAALGLRPGYATARQWHAEFLAFKGRTDEALDEISIALEFDPFSLVINRMKGNILGFAKRNDEAIAQLNRTAELYPDSPIVRFNLGEAYAAKGMHEEAIEQYLIGFKLDGRKSYEIRRYENAFKFKGMQGFWMEYLASLITLQKALEESDDDPAYFDYESLAYAYAATRNKEKAIENLYRAYDVRDPSLITIKTSDVYDFLEDDPRYVELIRKIGLAN